MRPEHRNRERELRGQDTETTVINILPIHQSRAATSNYFHFLLTADYFLSIN